jgi:hypothetical protein
MFVKNRAFELTEKQRNAIIYSLETYDRLQTHWLERGYKETEDFYRQKCVDEAYANSQQRFGAQLTLLDMGVIVEKDKDGKWFFPRELGIEHSALHEEIFQETK